MVVANMNGTWPPRMPCCASPPPLYGTSVSSTPVARRNISSERCGVVPMPACPAGVPGFAFSSAISSPTFVAATDGCTTSTSGAAATLDTGAKSSRR